MKTLSLLFTCFSFFPILPLQNPVLKEGNRTGTDYAIFFYVTDFQPGWPALPETAKETAALKTELETSFGFTCELVANPTKQQIRDKIRAYNARLTDKDQVLFFFSMHGHYDDNSERGYLVGKDGRVDDPYHDSLLSYDDLRTDLVPCRARHILLALDACHSGSFGVRNKSKPEAPAFSQAEDCAQRVARMLKYSGRQFCSAGNKESKTPAKSLFANRFLEALRKGGEDGILCFDDLEYFLGKVENPKPESGTFKGHEPGGDFVFVRKEACYTPSSVSKAESQLTSHENNPKPSNGSISPNLPIDLSQYGYRANDFVLVNGGTYMMGSLEGAGDEKPVHQVTLGNFYLYKYEVSISQFKKFIDATGFKTDAEKKGGSWVYDEVWKEKKGVSWRCDTRGNTREPSEYNEPVLHVSWEDAQAYCKWLNQVFDFKEGIFRLPTEAEWEYAAGGGNGQRTSWAGTNEEKSILKYANYDTWQDGFVESAPSGSLLPNTLGFYDMSGNVWEWCLDWYDADYYRNSPEKNPRCETGTASRVVRGGSWDSRAQYCRVVHRNYFLPQDRNGSLGFRIAKTP